MTYKLINNQTKENHLCDKVTIDGFDYYITNNEISENDYYVVPHNIDGKILSQNFILGRADKNFMVNYYINTMKDWWRKVIATNNPNIDIPKVISEVKIPNYYFTDQEPYYSKSLEIFLDGYNESQEMYPFTDDDMINFAEFVFIESFSSDRVRTPKELLEIWKKDKYKIVYYE